MNSGSSKRRHVSFGPFEVDLQTGELRKSGVKVRLQEQPFRILSVLLERPGEVVTRDELRERLWPDDTFVEFEQGLNAAVNRLRTALADSANDPRWIETVPRRGYRFLGAIESGRPAQSAGAMEQPRTAPATAESVSNAFRNRERLAWGLAAGLAITLFASLYFRPSPMGERPIHRWSFAPEALSTQLRNAVISPNGRHIAYRAGPDGPSIWVRDLDREEPRRLAGTEGAGHGFFWSPDCRWIGFATDVELKKISVDGGPAVSLCKVTGGFNEGSWSPDGETIAFTSGARIYEVSSRGGEAKLLFEPEETAKGQSNFYAHFLPVHARARSVVLAVGGTGAYDVVLKNLETGDSQVLGEGVVAAYAPSGHIVFDKDSDAGVSLWALPFSLDTLQPTGEAFPIAENGGRPSVAEDGTLVYVATTGPPLRQLVWRDREGNKLGEIGQPQRIVRYPVLSPDGRHVATSGGELGNYDVWVHEVDRPMTQRLTFDAANDGWPQWSPTGRQITFQSNRAGNYDIFHRAADGTGETELLLGSEADERPHGWSHDGNDLVYTAHGAAGYDLWHLKRKPNGEGFKSFPFLQTPFNEQSPSLSPDSRFIAYCSDQSGDYQVYVQSFPSGDGLWQVSTSGGCQPRWSRDGKELFYVQSETLMVVEVQTSPGFIPVSTTPLFSDPQLSQENTNQFSYDVSADGRFVMVDDAGGAEAKPPTIHVVENWYEEFRHREQR